MWPPWIVCVTPINGRALPADRSLNQQRISPQQLTHRGSAMEPRDALIVMSHMKRLLRCLVTPVTNESPGQASHRLRSEWNAKYTAIKGGSRRFVRVTVSMLPAARRRLRRSPPARRHWPGSRARRCPQSSTSSPPTAGPDCAPSTAARIDARQAPPLRSARVAFAWVTEFRESQRERLSAACQFGVTVYLVVPSGGRG